MGVRCDGSLAGGNARSTVLYVYLPRCARERCTSVNGSLTMYHNHISFLGSLALPPRRLVSGNWQFNMVYGNIMVTVGGHRPPVGESSSI